VYKKLVIERDRLVGACLYGDTGDAAWYLICCAPATAWRPGARQLLFGQAASTAHAPAPDSTRSLRSPRHAAMKPASAQHLPRGLRRHLLAWTGAVVAVPAAAQADLAEAINPAGRCMLSQRMVKARLPWPRKHRRGRGPGAEPVDQPVRAPARAAQDRSRRGRRRPPMAPEPAWQTLREGLMAPPSPARAAALLPARPTRRCWRGSAGHLASSRPRPAAHGGPGQSGRPPAHAVAALAKFYFAGVPGRDAGQAARRDGARAANSAGSARLRQAPDTSARIAEELTLAEGQRCSSTPPWPVCRVPARAPGLCQVFVASENLLSVMDRVTGLYAALKT
jgi:hypothetical protein